MRQIRLLKLQIIKSQMDFRNKDECLCTVEISLTVFKPSQRLKSHILTMHMYCSINTAIGPSKHAHFVNLGLLANSFHPWLTNPDVFLLSFELLNEKYGGE